MPVTWSQEQDRILTQMWEDGKSSKQISMALIGKSRNAVIGRARRIGLSERKSAGWKQTSNCNPITRMPAKKSPTLRITPRAQNPLLIVQRSLPAAPYKSPQEPADAPEPLALTLLDLEAHQCKWPINDGGPFLFCGHERAEGSSYCEHHQSVAYRGAPPAKVSKEREAA